MAVRRKTEDAFDAWQSAVNEATRPPTDDEGLTRKELAAGLKTGIHKLAGVIDRGVKEGWIVEGRRHVRRSGMAGTYPIPVYRLIGRK